MLPDGVGGKTGLSVFLFLICLLAGAVLVAPLWGPVVVAVAETGFFGIDVSEQGALLGMEWDKNVFQEWNME